MKEVHPVLFCFVWLATLGMPVVGPGTVAVPPYFCPRMGDGWAYLEVYPPRSQSSEKDLLSAPVTVRISMVSEGVAR